MKTIKGHRYVYMQQTYREGNHVRTRNRYLGPAGAEAGASGSQGMKREPASGSAGIAAAVAHGLADLGREAARQFDAPRWGSDAATQLGLSGAKTKQKRKTVTTTKRRVQRLHAGLGTAPLYDPEDLSPAGRITASAIEKVFARIPDGTTDPGGYIVKRQGKLFPTEKLSAQLQAYIGIALADDGSIIEGVTVNTVAFTENVALSQISQQTDRHGQSSVTTTHVPQTSHPRDGGNSPHTADAPMQRDAHRKYFVNEDVRITSPKDAVRLCREMLAAEDAIDRDKEHFYVLHLNVRSRVTMIEVVSIGTVSSSVVHPRETFHRAIAEGSSNIIITHNHPSGEVEPSDEDTRVTKLMFDAAQVIGIAMLDHIVFSDTKAWSFRDNKRIE